MSGEERRMELLNLIKSNPTPLSGTELSTRLNVSRQVIVQDIALLRASDYDIISTNKGYILNNRPVGCTRVFKVHHEDSEIEDELNTIVDAGGKVIDVFVNHEVYGKISASLEIYSRRDVKKYMEHMKNNEAVPLKNVTSGEHFHTVTAYSEEIMQEVENSLREKGYLIQ